MRIVSLDPGATEVVCSIGLAEELVGIADDPSGVDLPLVAEVPFVARARRDATGLRELRVDDDALEAADPDLVIVPGRLERPAGTPAKASVLTFDPASLEGVFNAIATIGAMTSAEDAALELVEDLRDQLVGIEERVRERAEEGHRPARVVALEWLAPPHSSGLWIPEQVRRAGGWEVLGREGAPAGEISWESILEVDPEALFLMPRGLGLRETIRAWEAFPKPPDWQDLAAVRRGNVIAVDGRSYFGTPGPRLLEGVGLLAELLDPNGFSDLAPPAGWAPLG